jgi:hypothetical protein
MAEGPGGGPETHPNDDLLLALHDGVLFPGDRPLVQTHLKGCPRCRARLLALTEDPLPAPVAAASPPASRPSAPPAAASPAKAVATRLAIVVGVFGALGIAGWAVRRELERRTAEPVALANTPAIPPRTATPTAAPAPAPAEPVVPPADTAADAPPIPAEPIVVTSPNRNFRWRVSGLDVERTTDGGGVWRKQAVALPKSINAGMAPSAAVCWLVGRDGTVLVAVGSEWKNVSMPQPIELIRVTAQDSMTATVTAMDGRQFSTVDAGVTWTPLQP